MAVERVGEQHLARSDRVGAVDDDDIVALALRHVAAHEFGAVGDHQLQPRVVEGPVGDGGQVGLGELHPVELEAFRQRVVQRRVPAAHFDSCALNRTAS